MRNRVSPLEQCKGSVNPLHAYTSMPGLPQRAPVAAHVVVLHPWHHTNSTSVTTVSCMCIKPGSSSMHCIIHVAGHICKWHCVPCLGQFAVCFSVSKLRTPPVSLWFLLQWPCISSKAAFSTVEQTEHVYTACEFICAFQCVFSACHAHTYAIWREIQQQYGA